MGSPNYKKNNNNKNPIMDVQFEFNPSPKAKLNI